MNIPFRRITKTPQEFEVSSGNVTLKGTLALKQRDLVLMKARLTGTLRLPCDICAEPFDTVLDEELELLLSDGVFEGSDDNLDVVEMHHGTIDMEEILHSEIELIRSDYHSCENCTNQNERN
jgi:uncharacterized metal-binding protein YceD (DUF177 family)